MKKILKYSTIIGTSMMLAGSAIADTGGYVRVKGFDSHFQSLGFNELGCTRTGGMGANETTNCKFADEKHDLPNVADQRHDNELHWNSDDGEGLVVGADFGFFRLEVEGTYQDGKAVSWRGHTATGGTVYQARLFANVVAEPLDLLALLGEFGGVEPLVKYNPATYGISPYAMYGYGVMGGLLTNLAYTRTGSAQYVGRTADAKEDGAFAGGATAAVNVGAGVNIGLDKLARGFSDLSGSTLPEYFKLPIEFSVGYHFQAGLDDLLFESMDEDLGIDDGGITYSIGLKW
tara:strand:+ start:179 stop:1045 length:867 start_codon:yes stop_codon:yes gene_type:complete